MKYLGVIVVGTNAAKNNKDTAAPFTLPKNVRAIGLQSDVAGVFMGIGIGDAFAIAAGLGRRLGQFEWVEFNTAGVEWVASIRNDTGGGANIKVFALT